MAPLTFTPAELADVLADPDAAAQLSVHGATSHLVVQVDGPTDLHHVPGLGLPCVVIAAAADPDLAGACGFADVVLSGDGVDSLAALPGLTRSIESTPLAAASYAMLLRSADSRYRSLDTSIDQAVLDGLIAESTCYSMLQSGTEFTAWRATRAPRTLDDQRERVRVVRRDDALDVVLTRPDKRNALDTRMRDELFDALGIALLDKQIRVQLRALGPSFSAGGDLDEFGARRDPTEAHLTRMARSVGWIAHRISDRLDVYLHGACMGSGIEIPAFAGRVHAAPDTVIGLPELSLGLIPGAGGTVSVTRRIGRHRTAFLGLSGSIIDVDTALAWGLVDTIDHDRNDDQR